MPSAMQAVRNRAPPTGHGVFPGFNSEFQSDPGFSWTSTYTPRSHEVNKKARSSRSFRERLVKIARPCANCFVSTPSEIKEAHEIPSTDVHDASMTPNMHGGHLSVEFRSEIQMLSKVEHLNLVKFLGYVEYENEHLILVEYVNNGTLRQHLDDHPIIHRDIKSSNILLTEQLRAKVADFGFARLAHENPEATHVSTLVKGTAGYVDPEYLRTNQLTDRSDVYSFGVLLVELVTGRRPIERGRGRRHHQSLTTEWVNHAHPNQTSSSDTKMYAREVFDEITVLEQALRKCKEGDVVVVMDTRMRRTSAVVAAVEKVMALASECTAPERAARPAMRRCAEVLWSVRRDLQQEQQRVAAAAASAGARRHGGSTSAPPSATSLRQERVENLR
ncbi:hypothetical protein HU200_026142 [Digitaria exilis]|uniref:Protein kinase domain-containing protein n=1 Tax=Digitaria exilis TaxID=1010633 RepID=A0A835ES90_9POAL|nr:hypothetical protein HU200_026142 [Digitaria exilis]